MSSFLFDEFDPVSPAAWKQKIQVDLKGEDYNDSLLWKTPEGIIVKPFYTKEDRKNHQINLPKKGFAICQSIFVDKETIANTIAVNSIKKGATSIEFTAKKEFDFNLLLKDINLEEVVIYFNFQFLSVDFIKNISKQINQKNTFFNIDIIGNLAKTGNWFTNLKEDFSSIEKTLNLTTNSISVNASLYQNAGANIAQELAYTLAHANEYLEYFGENVIDKVHFNFSVGSNYFFEIAKLRAFRILWNTLINQNYSVNKEAHIFTKPSLRNKTLYDYNVNMLRTTSECMSAVLGGSNTVCNVSYDTIYHKSNEFGERISRNQLLILQQESELSESQNYADGSYYIEAITQQLADKALQIFKQIEKSGGFLKLLKKRIIQNKILESANKEQELFNSKNLYLLGTNILLDKKNRMSDSLDIYPFLKLNRKKTLISPILTKRLSEESEQIRLKNEKYGDKN
ncbi:heterodimeric methylmalonyl-CoA mutase small subunit [Lutibacter sp. Hel_I_33_5]|uniref:methylmalonyl-CoA mutase subunit beta n=1 Tax=Lutibacter sp. Hel_I_33_5 TaxID=1566289 RepID=UPI0011A83731|nr:methylmalonyl-CoA mutase subunit beta [Lutibacter sp. Hel_I_33_5]TVZ55752.1 heterodimeric methylmalonyl-CoA mutase small subunit [Lutibacter sp. Hel_I_33_5]